MFDDYLWKSNVYRTTFSYVKYQDIYYHEWKQAIWLPLSSPSRKKHMSLPGFEPGSPRPQSKSDDLDRSAMGPTVVV